MGSRECAKEAARRETGTGRSVGRVQPKNQLHSHPQPSPTEHLSLNCQSPGNRVQLPPQRTKEQSPRGCPPESCGIPTRCCRGKEEPQRCAGRGGHTQCLLLGHSSVGRHFLRPPGVRPRGQRGRGSLGDLTSPRKRLDGKEGGGRSKRLGDPWEGEGGLSGISPPESQKPRLFLPQDLKLETPHQQCGASPPEKCSLVMPPYRVNGFYIYDCEWKNRYRH